MIPLKARFSETCTPPIRSKSLWEVQNSCRLAYHLKIVKPDQTRTDAPKPLSLVEELPFGVVMATAALSQIAKLVHFTIAVKPFVWLAVAEVILIVAFRIPKIRFGFKIDPQVSTHTREYRFNPGMFTIPLGISVTAAGVLQNYPGTLVILGISLYIMAWLSEIGFLFDLAKHLAALVLSEIDGGWFLIPASFLSLGATSLLGASSLGQGYHHLLYLTAMTSSVIGVVGYYLVVVLTVFRLLYRGFPKTHIVLWWISAGCAGLSSFALAKQLSPVHISLSNTTFAILKFIDTMTWSFGLLLLMPIVWFSLVHLFRLRHFPKSIPWPPTFSTAVFALGSFATGALVRSEWVYDLGVVTGTVALVLWAVTVMLIFIEKLNQAKQRFGQA